MIEIKASGSSPSMEQSLYNMRKINALAILNRAGQQGVDLLASATPRDTGLTAESWEYEVEYKRGKYTVTWSNTNVNDGTPVVILLQYGHGTGTGGYVEGVDFINPAMRSLFDKIAADMWEEVKNA